jgi:hypothetical protein
MINGDHTPRMPGFPETQADLWVLPLEGDRKPFSLLQTIATPLP